MFFFSSERGIISDVFKYEESSQSNFTKENFGFSPGQNCRTFKSVILQNQGMANINEANIIYIFLLNINKIVIVKGEVRQ